MSKGMVIAEFGHPVNIMPPIDLNGTAKNSDVFSMAKHAHASIIIQSGVSAGTVATVKVQACDDFTPSNTTDLAFTAYKCETAFGAASGDVLGARTAVAATGLVMNTTDNIFYVIEIDASELTAGKPNLRLAFSDPAASQILSAVAILSGSRFASDQSPTVTA